MKIDHIGIWVTDLDKMIEFYKTYFKATAGKKYHNPFKNFTSCFLKMPSGPGIELMNNPSIPARSGKPGDQYPGYIHIAISMESEPEVNRQTEFLRENGYTVLDGPRRTGDGYYESVIIDPEGNRIEITV